MKIVKVADDGTVTAELTAAEAQEVRGDLDAARWSDLSGPSRALYHHLDMVAGRPSRRPTVPTFPGGGI